MHAPTLVAASPAAAAASAEKTGEASPPSSGSSATRKSRKDERRDRCIPPEGSELRFRSAAAARCALAFADWAAGILRGERGKGGE